MNAAFVRAPLPTRARHELPPRTRTRPPHHATQMTAGVSLSSRLSQRARDDIALLQKLSHNAARGAATAAAVGALMCGAWLGPALADVPTEAPGTFLFDEPAVVQKGSADLFSKAAANIKVKQGVAVRFVMVKSLPYNETPNEYAQELFESWGLGDSDVLLVASPKLARAGIYVGSSVANLTPEIADSICNETYALEAGDEKYGKAVLEVSNRLIPVLSGETDPGPPDMSAKEAVQTYKTKKETESERGKYVAVVGTILVISVVAPLIQTYWYVRDD